ncbi:hypothetical protein FRC00_007407 [Tulasnella sp. 408]|nr:hypothetical protein FRC00_007407 [Tulasnella sp. 408]
MADIDELERAASAFPDLDDIGPAAVPSGQTSFPDLGQGGIDGFDDDDDFGPIGGGTTLNKGPTSVKVTGDDMLEKFEDQFPDLGDTGFSAPPPPISVASQQPSFYQSPPIQQQPQQSMYGSGFPAQQVEEEEPEVIKQWRAQQEERIRERDAASEKKRQDTISKAEQAIDQFYQDYNSKKEREIAENKKNEEEYKASLTDALAAGTTWSRICDLIELENSQSKTVARAGPGTTDLARMREVLLRLRREGENAPGAAGY